MEQLLEISFIRNQMINDIYIKTNLGRYMNDGSGKKRGSKAVLSALG